MTSLKTHYEDIIYEFRNESHIFYGLKSHIFQFCCTVAEHYPVVFLAFLEITHSAFCLFRVHWCCRGGTTKGIPQYYI